MIQDPGVICNLSHMCKEATLTTRVTIDAEEEEEKKIITFEDEEPKVVPIDEQSKMLCNVLVRATHELHVNQQKNRDEIQSFLKNDCQKLSTPELVQKVRDIIEFDVILQ